MTDTPYKHRTNNLHFDKDFVAGQQPRNKKPKRYFRHNEEHLARIRIRVVNENGVLPPVWVRICVCKCVLVCESVCVCVSVRVSA